MRLVLPGLIVVHAAGLDEAAAEGRTAKLLELLRQRAAGPVRGRGARAATVATHPAVPPEPGIPVALRWSSQPDLGFPRAPFLVWRRARDYKAGVSLGAGPFAVSGYRVVTWTAGDMLEVLFRATPTTGSLVVEALDVRGEAIPGQRLTFTSSSLGAFRSPAIAALRVTGDGSVRSLVGVDPQALANAPDWQLIQRVGFPYAKGEIAAPAYSSAPQGYEPAGLEGLDAAVERLEIARVLQLDPPDAGLPGVVTPAWPAPDPKLYLQVLRDPQPSPVSLITACLTSTDDTDPARLQADFRVDVTVDGIRQPNIPGATPGDPATAHLPVVGVTMLSVANDSDAATGLGFGTVDIPPLRRVDPPYGDALTPPGIVFPAFDHMITAEFTLPFFGTLELAAIAGTLLPPASATPLLAQATAGDRPATVDVAATQVVTLSWPLPPGQEAYGLAVTRTAGVSDVLNAARAFSAGGYDPYVPVRPANVNGGPPPGARVRYSDPSAPVPLAGSAASRYLVIGRDVAGRWSPWTSVVHTAIATPVETPGLLSAAFELPAAPLAVPATGRSTAGALVVECSWDWADRTPERIELFGRFMAPTGTPDATFSGGFQMSPTGPLGAAVAITFGAAGGPAIASGHAGTVEELPAAGPTPGELRRYRVRLTGLTCDFATATAIAFPVTARGFEHVRPTTPSAVVGPRIARAQDPFEPVTPSLPIDLIWTALPDAAGRARAVLTWPATPGATKYVVWEATEAALRTAVAPTAAPPASGTSILARAGALRSLVTADAASQALSLKAFSRMHDRPLTATRLEVELPAAADTLYAYRVSSLTDTNIESPRSASVALVAVPRRSIPGRPRVLLRRSESPPGIDVVVLPGPGAVPSGYRIHRVRSAAAAGDVGTMGPPVATPSSPGWRSVSVPSLTGPAEPGLAWLDAVPRDWSAYHYRAVAIGQSDPTNGLYPGESGASGAQTIVLPPIAGPVVTSVTRTAGNAANQLLSFRTDLPVRASSAGVAGLSVSAVATTGGTPTRHRLLDVDPSTVAAGPGLTVLPVGSPQLADLPHVSRGTPDATGMTTWTIRLPRTLPDGATGGTIAVRDPLGRALEVPW